MGWFFGVRSRTFVWFKMVAVGNTRRWDTSLYPSFSFFIPDSLFTRLYIYEKLSQHTGRHIESDTSELKTWAHTAHWLLDAKRSTAADEQSRGERDKIETGFVYRSKHCQPCRAESLGWWEPGKSTLLGRHPSVPNKKHAHSREMRSCREFGQGCQQ